MHDVYIVGAGGYGRLAFGQMRDDPACHRAWRIAGFLDSRAHLLDGRRYDAKIVGDPATWVPGPNDRFVCAVGRPADREHYSAPLLSRGAQFISIATETYFSVNVAVGDGCFFERRVAIGPDCTIGRFVNIHSLAILGHDITIGDFSQISCFTFIGGGATIGARATIYPHAVILPGVEIGDGATIGAGSVVIKNVRAGETVFGNPARRLQ